ncbi:MAG: hypothetical protein ACR2NP_13620 [Pirellulaceae bacterium]
MNHPAWKLLALTMVAGLLFAAMGCSHWARQPQQDTPASRSPFSKPRLAPGSVALEIAVVTLDVEQLGEFDEIWQLADLQGLPLSDRRKLDGNGFRVGRLGTQLPGKLTAILEWTRPLITSEGEPLANADSPLVPLADARPFSIKQLEQLQPGVEHWTPCSPMWRQMSWTVDSGTQQRSGQCELASCGWRISQVPAGDGEITLWLRPAIQHGQRKLRYAIDEESILVQEKQKTMRLRELDFRHPLRLGQTLMVTWNGATSSLGQQFLGGPDADGPRRMLLIRPVQTGDDDLFTDGNHSRRLSTRLD